jgi:uncharacterized protein with ATP-grasp and redox domains
MLRPPLPIPTNVSNAFAHHTMHTRVPANIREVQTLNADYPVFIHTALDRLHDEITANQPIAMLQHLAQDYDDWAAAHAAQKDATWLNAVWFFAETFLYRRIVEAVRWFETGRDPFAPKKHEEFTSLALWHTLEETLATHALDSEERLGALIEFGVWGNRIDLSYALVAAHGTQGTQEDLLVNHTPQVVEHLLDSTGDIHIVCDNSGTELAMDCALADALLEQGHRVVFHVKSHPFFVSDTTVPDIHTFLHLLRRREGEAYRLGERLSTAFGRGQWRLAPDVFWCSSQFLWQMPPRLQQAFSNAQLVILKGDLNYRRSVGDAIWDTVTPYEDVVSYFPAPLLALRTLKSDPIVGLAPGMATALDQVDALWRTNGRRGLIQSRLQAKI